MNGTFSKSGFSSESICYVNFQQGFLTFTFLHLPDFSVVFCRKFKISSDFEPEKTVIYSCGDS